VDVARKNWGRRLNSFARQTDVQAAPGRAVARRVRWRLHHALFPNRFFEIRAWTRGLSIALPNTGAAAQIYYRTFSSLYLAQAITEELSAGMHFLDVGAHVGEYSLLAASLVGPAGRVTAVEPQPDLASVIHLNAARNGLSNVQVHAIAVSDRSGRLTLPTSRRGGGAWLSGTPSPRGRLVDCRTLDSFLRAMSDTPIDLAKVDAGGNEGAAFMGAHESLNRGALPRLIYKLYHPAVVASRSNYPAASVITLLSDLGYEQRPLAKGASAVTSVSEIDDLIGAAWYSIPILARRPELS
jgi:FkbM family methyltransferase